MLKLQHILWTIENIAVRNARFSRRKDCNEMQGPRNSKFCKLFLGKEIPYDFKAAFDAGEPLKLKQNCQKME